MSEQSQRDQSSTGASASHPHEPSIPPALDREGRCLVCMILVERDKAEADLKVVQDALHAIARQLGWWR